MDDLKKGMATPGFKAVGDDLAKFATGGLIGMVAVETGEKGIGGVPGARHRDLQHAQGHARPSSPTTPRPTCRWSATGQPEIGFTRADLTRFESNLDGSAPAEYRQAELCFNSMDELKKGTATPAFKKVGDDLPKFATGGLTALIGEQQ